MAGFRLDVRADVNAMIRKNSGLQEKLLRAAVSAINATAKDVRSAAIEEIATRNREFKKHVVTGYVTVKAAKYSNSSVRGDGLLRVNYGGISATVTTAGKAPNLIYFVPPAARTAAAWRNSSGVAAHVAGRTTVYDGSFIVRAKNGKMIVVSRSAAAKAYPQGLREKTSDGKWKWKPKWSKALYGPPLPALASNENTRKVMLNTATTAWPGYWRRAYEKVLAAGAE